LSSMSSCQPSKERDKEALPGDIGRSLGPTIKDWKDNCDFDSPYLYHHTRDEARLEKILAQKNVKTGEFTTRRFFPVGQFALAFTKKNLQEKEVKPCFPNDDPPKCWSRVQYLRPFPGECAWVKEDPEMPEFNAEVKFELSDVAAIISREDNTMSKEQVEQLKGKAKETLSKLGIKKEV